MPTHLRSRKLSGCDALLGRKRCMAQHCTTGCTCHTAETYSEAKILRQIRVRTQLPHSKLKNFLAEAGEDEFDAEERGAIVFVEDGIDLYDFEGIHRLGVGNHFHGEMSFP